MSISKQDGSSEVIISLPPRSYAPTYQGYVNAHPVQVNSQQAMEMRPFPTSNGGIYNEQEFYRQANHDRYRTPPSSARQQRRFVNRQLHSPKIHPKRTQTYGEALRTDVESTLRGEGEISAVKTRSDPSPNREFNSRSRTLPSRKSLTSAMQKPVDIADFAPPSPYKDLSQDSSWNNTRFQTTELTLPPPQAFQNSAPPDSYSRQNSEPRTVGKKAPHLYDSVFGEISV